jgi:energy-coupling factor transporter transmembrane protein EcfT
VGRDSGVTSGRRFVAASAGALFGKAHGLSEEVYLAMVSRGYTGHVRMLAQPRTRAYDVVWCAGCATFAVLVVWGGHVTW